MGSKNSVCPSALLLLFPFSVFAGRRSKGEKKEKKEVCYDCYDEQTLSPKIKHYPFLAVKMLSQGKQPEFPEVWLLKAPSSQPWVCLFPPSQRFLRNQACRFVLRASPKARMAPHLREHLANKGRPNEREQMVRENSPVVPWEQQERGEWGHSQGGSIS